eukprot:CAMPEP_0197653076 /NCGR_PEP_ID=MMETSP1338-20131121/34833_1 /TAXON_ID=43686 ORGANISM="Pelagodinium beii, Strain RCC1491" /NCGR_SAMPLE_ID=MMETSP1338 /ASSEMBLY_ACC=CAM_ASM_000754 /LENGTH=313 /DNA_ID=CAMNT_0043228077 /DNA_START=26 /DNA_END=964 /DNA_ORIENTATION=-
MAQSVREEQKGHPDPQVLGSETAGAASLRVEASRSQGKKSRRENPRGEAKEVTSIVEAIEQSIAHTEEVSLSEKDVAFLAQEATTQNDLRWVVLLVVISMLDFLMSGIIAGVALTWAWRDDGVSLLTLAVQVLSHLASSLALVSRFMGELLPARDPAIDGGEVSDELLLLTRRRRDLAREQAIGITVGCLMLVSSAVCLFKAMRKLKFWDKWYLDHQEQDEELEHVTDLLAWWGFSIYAIQGSVRFVAARKLRRTVIWNTLGVSVVSMLYLLILGFAASYEREWSWKAEPIAAMVLVGVCLVEGIRVIYNHFA